MSFPSYLEYFSSSIENVSVARFKVQPASNSSVQSHQTIQFNLPQNALLDMRKMRVHFQVTTTGDHARLPTMASSYFNRISFEIGGQQISAFEHANLLDHVLKNNLQIDCDPVNEKAYLARLANPSTLLDTAANETYDVVDGKTFLSIDLGTLARSINPSIVAMSYLAQVSVILHLAENAVVASPKAVNVTTDFVKADAAGVQSGYTIQNSFMTTDVYDIQGSDLMQIYQQTMADQGFLELTYSNWSSFSDTFNTVSRASSSAMSLKRIVATFRRGTNKRPMVDGAGGFNAVKGVVATQGYSNTLLASASNVGAITLELGVPATNGTDFESAFFTMTAPVKDANAEAHSAMTKIGELDPQLNILVNSVAYPAYNCPLQQWYDIKKSCWNVKRSKSESLAEYYTNKFDIGYRFDLPDSSALRLMSGLNLKSSNAQIAVQLTGNTSTATTDDNIVIWMESDAILRVGAGKQSQILN